MAVRALNHLGGHAQVPGSLPDRDTALHQPSRGCVSKRVRCNAAPQPGDRYGMLEPRLDGFDRGPVPFHEMRRDDATADPAPHMRKEPRRNGRRRLPLLTRLAANSEPIENPVVEIDE